MEKNIEFFGIYDLSIKELKEKINNLPDDWKFNSIEYHDHDDSDEILVIIHPDLVQIFKECDESLYDELAQFICSDHQTYDIHIEKRFLNNVGESSFTVYVFGELDFDELDKYISQPDIESEIFKQKYQGKKTWISLDEFNDIFDMYDIEEYLKVGE